jgi:hypothetical protein
MYIKILQKNWISINKKKILGNFAFVWVLPDWVWSALKFHIFLDFLKRETSSSEESISPTFYDQLLAQIFFAIKKY